MTDLSDILFDGFDIHYLIFDMKLSVILLNYMYIHYTSYDNGSKGNSGKISVTYHYIATQ